MKWTKYFIFSFISFCFAKSPNKIIGGTRVNVRDFYYVVSVQFRDTHLCGGSIFSRYYVLTTASCVTLGNNILVANLKLIMGTNDLLDTSNSTSIDVSYIIYHDEYNPNNFWMNDIALLKVTTPIVFSTNCCSIGLSYSLLKHGHLYELAGWGGAESNNEDYTPSRYLYAIYLLNAALQKCWDPSFIPDYGKRRIGCAKSRSEHQAITLGDGGSGLLFNERIVGLVSYYVRGRNSLIFTKIFVHQEWIETMMARIDTLCSVSY